MWVYIPNGYCPSVPEPGDSTSALEWRSDLLASSCALNTKQPPSKSWQRAWKKAGWMQRLYGRIYAPSMANLGAALWRESLAVTHASHSAWQGSSAEPKTPATFGPTLLGSSVNVSQNGASSRTYQTTFGWDTSIAFDQSLSAKVTQLRKEYSQRRRSALLTGESGCLSSLSGDQMWPSVSARDFRGAPDPLKRYRRTRLLDEAAEWDFPRSLLAHQTSKYGSEYSKQTYGLRHRLNRTFCEWLMGWPLGWTSLLPLESESQVMESYRKWLSLRSEHSQGSLHD